MPAPIRVLALVRHPPPAGTGTGQHPSICIRGDPGQARRLPLRQAGAGSLPPQGRAGLAGGACQRPPPLPAHEQVLVRLYEGWRAAGARVAGIQIDFDAATRQLDRYGNALQQLRRALPPGCKLSVTGLLDWAKTGDVAELNRLPVDELVIQTYQGTRTVPGYQAYLPAMAHLTIPFKVGLVQDGEWDPAWQTTLAASPLPGRGGLPAQPPGADPGTSPLFPGMTPTETRVNPIGTQGARACPRQAAVADPDPAGGIHTGRDAVREERRPGHHIGQARHRAARRAPSQTGEKQG